MIVLVTDPSKSDADLARIVRSAAEAIPAGELYVLLRDKSRDDTGALALATELRKITADLGQLLLIHRHHLRLALEVGADGVHDPDPALDGRAHKVTDRVIVSGNAHADDDVRRAIGKSIDLLLVSPIFDTPNKGPARGLAAIQSAREITGNRASPKIVALGGVDASSAADCMRAGADGVAVIRCILHASDPRAAASALWRAVASASTFSS